MRAKLCASCGHDLPLGGRADRRFCSGRCRIRAHRTRRGAGARKKPALSTAEPAELQRLRRINREQSETIAAQQREIEALEGLLAVRSRAPASHSEAGKWAAVANQQVDDLLKANAQLLTEKAKAQESQEALKTEHRKALEALRATARQQAMQEWQAEREQMQAKMAESEAKARDAASALAHLVASNDRVAIADTILKASWPKRKSSQESAPTPPPAEPPREPPWHDALADSVRQEEELWAQYQQRRAQLGMPPAGRFMRGTEAAPEQAAALAFRRRLDRFVDGENDDDPSIVWTEVRCRLDAASEKLLLEKSATKIAQRKEAMQKLQRGP